MGKHDTSDDRDWLERNQERSHRARMPFGRTRRGGRKDSGLVCGDRVGAAGRAWVSAGRCLFFSADFRPTAGDEAVAQALFDVAVRREAVPPGSETLCTLI